MAAHLTVISKNSVSKIRDEGELDTFFKEHPAAQDPFLLFNLGSDVPRKLLFSLYEKYPDTKKQSRLSPVGFGSHGSNKATLDPSPPMQVLKCDCQRCTEDGENCDLELIFDMEILTHVTSKGGVEVRVAGTLLEKLSVLQTGSPIVFPNQGHLPQNLGINRLQALRVPGLSNQRPAEIRSEGGRITLELEGSPPVSFSRKVAKLQIFIKKAGFHTFGMGIRSHRTLEKAPAMYIAAELREICITWDFLLRYFKEFLTVANREILNKDATIDRNLVRKLANTADACEELLTVHQQQYGSWESLIELIKENKDWLIRSALESSEGGSAAAVLDTMEKDLGRLGRSGKVISDDLVVKNDKLIQRTHNLISIDDAYKAREQNASIKRLSWITSLFGMNADLLENNPSWTTYFYFAFPMFLLIMLAVVLLKQKGVFLRGWRYLHQIFLTQVLKRQDNPPDLEMQIGDRSEAVGSAEDWDEFFWAAENDSPGLLELQISRGINIDSRSSDGTTALELASGRGHMSIVKILLRNGADVNAPASTPGGRTALQAAAEYGHLPVVVHLLAKGAEVNAPECSRDGRTALQAAAGGGNLLVVEFLLGAGAEVNARAAEDGGRTALQAAAGSGNLPIVEHLLKKGAEVNAPGSWADGRTALQAAAGGGHLSIVGCLLESGAEVNASAFESNGRTALQAAAEGGYMPIVERLLKDGAEVNAPASTEGGRTALQAAAGGGHLPIVDFLLKDGAEVNAPGSDSNGRTALQAAAEGGHSPIVERLLEDGAEVNAPASDSDGRTALQAAAGGGHLPIVVRLLDEDAEVNAPASTKGGRTALQAAAEGGNLAIVKRLLDEGAEVNALASDEEGRTALQAAAGGGHFPIVEFLLNKDADVNAPGSWQDGRTALQAAAEGGHLPIVELLLAKGADVNAQGSEIFGVTAIQAAVQRGHMAVVQYLRLAGAAPPTSSFVSLN